MSYLFAFGQRLTLTPPPRGYPGESKALAEGRELDKGLSTPYETQSIFYMEQSINTHARRRRTFALLGIVLLLIISASYSRSQNTPAQPAYTITDLGIIAPGTDTTLSINDAGDVVGTAPGPGGLTRAFLWKNGTRSDLPLPPGYRSSVATGISGERSVGFVVDATDTRKRKAVIWEGTTVRELAALGGSRSIARAVSPGGTIVGEAQTASGTTHAVLYEGEKTTDIGVLEKGDFSAALGINDRGAIVGSANIAASGSAHAFLYTGGVLRDLGLMPEGKLSQARAINDRGEVVGWGDADDGLHAFLYRNGKMEDLGTLGDEPASAWAINEQTQIVGGSSVNERVFHAFLWQDGKMTDLNSLIPPQSGWMLRLAQGINERGQIVGVGRYKGQAHGFLLTPTNPVKL